MFQGIEPLAEGEQCFAGSTGGGRPVPGALHSFLDGGVFDRGHLQLNWNDYRLRSVFQPIVSFTHSSVVAHEALLRATDAQGHEISPLALFDRLHTSHERLWLDRCSRLMHMVNVAEAPGWFFLNLHPHLLCTLFEGDAPEVVQGIGEFARGCASRFVFEIVEEQITDHAHFEEGVAILRELGLGVALDDFGAGHSNFDRVWKIRPDVVKLDRSFATRTLEDRSARRLLPQIVSILHEAGTLVLLEGIETLEQARIAMDANIDFGQGWFFARPAARPLTDPLAIKPLLDQVWDRQHERAISVLDLRRTLIEPYLEAISQTAARIAAGETLEQASGSYLGLPHVACLYQLDAQGRQMGSNLNAPKDGPRRVMLGLGHVPGARWARRAYFIRAMREPGVAQSTRPYLSVASGNVCVTVSIQVEVEGRPVVICGDIDWEDVDQDSLF